MFIEITPEILNKQIELLHGNLKEFDFKSNDYKLLSVGECADLLSQTYGFESYEEIEKLLIKRETQK